MEPPDPAQPDTPPHIPPRPAEPVVQPPRNRVRAEFSCVSCGYSIRGRTIDELCPECGTPVLHSVGASTHKTTAGSAVASLVLGIVSVIGCMSYGVLSLICGPLAIFFGLKADKALKRGTAGGNTKGMATAGLIMGIIGTLLGLIGVAFFAVVIFSAATGGRFP